LNWLAILGATLASFALGGLWYGPIFGKAWMAAIGKKQEELPSNATPFIVSFVTALITSIVTSLHEKPKWTGTRKWQIDTPEVTP
jgi:hypothetical protein